MQVHTHTCTSPEKPLQELKWLTGTMWVFGSQGRSLSEREERGPKATSKSWAWRARAARPWVEACSARWRVEGCSRNEPTIRASFEQMNPTEIHMQGVTRMCPCDVDRGDRTRRRKKQRKRQLPILTLALQSTNEIHQQHVYKDFFFCR